MEELCVVTGCRRKSTYYCYHLSKSNSDGFIFCEECFYLFHTKDRRLK